jgi:TolA-binding protein
MCVCGAPRSELAVALEVSVQHARSLSDAQERHAAHAATAETLHSQIRALELQLAELPSAEEVRSLEAEAASRLGAALARAAELEVQLSHVEDTVVSERVERLVATTRALEIQLAEQASEADVAALLDKLRAADARAAELEAAGAAAAAVQVAGVHRLEEALRVARDAPPAPPASMGLVPAMPVLLAAAVAQPAAAVQTRTVVYPDGIQQQLRRIEELLVSLPAPELGAAGAAAVRHAPACM